jgi:hypothetical protein
MSDTTLTPPPLDIAASVAAATASWQDQDAVLREMWMQNHPPQAIADALNRSVSAIMTRAARLGLPRRSAPGRKPRQAMDDGSGNGLMGTQLPSRDIRRAPPKTVTATEQIAQTSPRVCLMCLTTFQSNGRHNRICSSCKGSSEYMSASTLADIHLPQS